MKRHNRSTIVEASADELYHAITDLKSWPDWDSDIESIRHDGSAPVAGTRFVLKPKGGPKTTLVVEAAQKPRRFTDVSLLPLGRMRTSHEFVPNGNGSTEVRLTIETYGLLGFLWNRVIARKQVVGADQQAHALAAFARAQRKP